MLYTEFIHKAIELCVQQLDNGNWYVEPEWKDMLNREGLWNPEALDDAYIDNWNDVEDILKLEAEKRNKRDSKVELVADWLYALATATIEPAMLQEETEYIKNVMEYLKVSHEKPPLQG